MGTHYPRLVVAVLVVSLLSCYANEHDVVPDDSANGPQVRSIKIIHRHKMIHDNSRFMLYCHYRVPSGFAVNVSLLYNGEPIPNNVFGKIHHTHHFVTLFVKHAHKWMTGNFTCAIRNGTGGRSLTSKTIPLRVQDADSPSTGIRSRNNNTGNSSKPFIASFTSSPRMAQYGKPLSLSCNVTGIPSPVVTFKHDQTELAQVLPANSHHGVYSIHTDHLKTSHGGNYTCEAANHLGSAVEHIIIAVPTIPKISNLSLAPHTPIQVGDHINITCTYGGSPMPTAEFYYRTPSGGLVLLTNSTQQTMTNGNYSATLHIRNIQVTDSGKYLCLVHTGNGVSLDEVARMKGNGYVAESLQVSVQNDSTPRITHLSVTPSNIVKKDDSMTIHCNSTGTPAPSISFWHNGEQVRPDSSGDFVTSHSEPGVMYLLQAKAKYNGHVITCEATNSFGTVKDAIKLSFTIQAKPVITLLETTPSRYVLSNSSVTITCLADGSPAPNITFRRNGKPLKMSDLYQVTANGKDRATLTIRHAREEDMGEYACIAFNQLAQDSRTINLEVLGMQTFTVGERALEHWMLNWHYWLIGGIAVAFIIVTLVIIVAKTFRLDKEPIPWEDPGIHVKANCTRSESHDLGKSPISHKAVWNSSDSRSLFSAVSQKNATSCGATKTCPLLKVSPIDDSFSACVTPNNISITPPPSIHVTQMSPMGDGGQEESKNVNLEEINKKFMSHI